MDTHMTHLEPETRIGQSARLPGEPDLDGDERAQPELYDVVDDDPDALRVARSKRRRRLLSGVALGVLVLVAAGVFVVSPFNTFVPIPASLVAGTHNLARPVLSAGSRAAPAEPGSPVEVSAPSTTTRHADPIPPRSNVLAPAASLATSKRAHPPAVVTVPPRAEQPREKNLDEIMALGADKAADASHEADAPRAGVPIPSPPPLTSEEPGAASAANSALPAASDKQKGRDITAAVTHAALGETASTAIKPDDATVSPAPAASTTTPATITVTPSAPPAAQPAAQPAVQPAVQVAPEQQEAAAGKPPVLVLSVPAGHQEQAEVLQFVTGLTSEIARLRSENESLRKDVSRRMGEQENRLADYNRRLSVAEARAAMRSVADAGKADDTPGPTSFKPVQPAIPAAPAPAEVKPATTAGTRLRYHVQAASPGLALLAEVGRGGGEGAQLQVAVGDQIPGYGVVKSVAQRGPNWVVQTEHGSID